MRRLAPSLVRRALRLVGVALLCASGVAGSAEDAATIPVAAFFHNPDIGDAKLSPSGRWLAITVHDGEGHGFPKVENRIDFWSRVERFLAEHPH
jgi:hypothetical protein